MLNISLAPNHENEWLNSAVDQEIIALNVCSLSGEEPHKYILTSPEVPRRNDGRTRDWVLRKYSHLELGGWWCSGVDPLNSYQPMEWGCFKPDKPRYEKEAEGFSKTQKKKYIKYEHPFRTETRAFFLRGTYKTGLKIASRYGMEEEYGDRVRLLDTRSQVLQTATAFEEKGSPIQKRPEYCRTEGSTGTSHKDREFRLSTEVLKTKDSGLWNYIHERGLPIILCEGAKKAAALLTAGFAAVAIPGVNSAYRVPKDEWGNKIGLPYLIPDLQHFATLGREVYICFDHDLKPETVKRVAVAQERIGELFERLGCRVKVISLPGPEKGVDDFLVARGEEFEALYAAAVPLEEWKIGRMMQLTFAANVRFNQRYLGEAVIPGSSKLVVIKAAKGTGKTEFLARQVQQAIYERQKVLVLTHRVQLGEALCDRFGIDYVTEIRTSETGGVLGYGLCVDSMHKDSQARFNPNDWSNAVVIIDECDQVFWHLLNSFTEVKNHRITVLRNLKTLVQNVLGSPRGRIYLSSADVADVDINYVRSLAGFPVEPFVIVNGWKPEAGKAYNYAGKDPSALVARLLDAIALGGNHFVCTSAQQVKSKWGTQGLEAYLRNKFPDKRILRIDSESVADPTHPAYGCIAHLNEVLPLYDIVITSPSIETGVSIDVRGHFSAVWGIFQGVQPENSVRQMLARLRETVDRHIWVAPTGLRNSRIGNGSTSVKALLKGQHQLAKANIALLVASGIEDLGLDNNFQQESLVTWAIKACAINAGLSCYRETITAGLAADGYEVIEVSDTEPDAGKELVEEITALRDEAHASECAAVAAASDLTEAEYKKLKDQKAKTKPERQAERKAELTNRYGVEVTPDLVAKDDKKWYSQIKVDYHLTTGRDFLAARDAKNARKRISEGLGAVWKPDFNREQLAVAVKTLEILGAADLMVEGKTFTATSPEMKKLADMAKRYKRDIKTCLGVTISDKDTPIAITQRLLGLMGLKLSYVGRLGSVVNRERVYKFERPCDGRDEIFSRWLERDQSLMSTSGNKEIKNSIVDRKTA